MAPLEEALREILADVTRTIVREELPAIVTAAIRQLGVQPHDAYLTATKVADVCGCTPATVREWIKQGTLAARKVGRGYLVCREELDRYLKGEVTKKAKDDMVQVAVNRIIAKHL